MRQKGFAPILIIVGVLILVAAAGGLYYLGTQKSSTYAPAKHLQEIVDTNKSISQKSDSPESTNTLLPTVTENNETLTPETAVETNKNIHLYPYYDANPAVNINNLHIIGIIFKPKDIPDIAKPERSKNMEKILQEIKVFFEREFKGKINITYQVIPETYIGDRNIEEYYPLDLAIELNTI